MLESSIPPVSLGRAATTGTFVFHAHELLVLIEGTPGSPAGGTDLSRLGLAELFRSRVDLYSNVKASAVTVEPPGETPHEFGFRPLRSLYGVLTERQMEDATTAYQILQWDQSSQFCGSCGSPNRPKEGDKGKVCGRCHAAVFPRISPATITAVIRDRRILLAHNHKFREGMYSLIAGFV